MHYRCSHSARRILTLSVVLFSLLGLPGTAHARDTLIWLLRDIPPLTIFTGPDQGEGAMDKLLPLLTARMPEYDHQIMRVNRARGMQMLRQESFTCDPTLMWSAERAETILYSTPVYAVPGNGLIVRRQQLAKFAPFMKGESVDLAALLASNSIRVGIVAERSYGETIDPILLRVPVDQLSLHYGSDAIASLLQMERLGRMDALISYWPEALYQAHQQGIATEDLAFLPVSGAAKYQFIHIGCSNTPQGRQAMEAINREIRKLRESKVENFYARWLPAAQREEYLQNAKSFFEKAGY